MNVSALKALNGKQIADMYNATNVGLFFEGVHIELYRLGMPPDQLNSVKNALFDMGLSDPGCWALEDLILWDSDPNIEDRRPVSWNFLAVIIDDVYILPGNLTTDHFKRLCSPKHFDDNDTPLAEYVVGRYNRRKASNS